MRRVVLLVIFAVMGSFALTPAAVAQDQYEGEVAPEVFEEQVEDPEEPQAENVVEGQQEAALEEQIETQQGAELTPQQDAALEGQAEVEGVQEQPVAEQGQPKMDTTTMTQTTTMMETTALPKSGGAGIGNPSVLLPAAALLLGAGVLALSAVRRR